jgi:hypothetical protein
MRFIGTTIQHAAAENETRFISSSLWEGLLTLPRVDHRSPLRQGREIFGRPQRHGPETVPQRRSSDRRAIDPDEKWLPSRRRAATIIPPDPGRHGPAQAVPYRPAGAKRRNPMKTIFLALLTAAMFALAPAAPPTPAPPPSPADKEPPKVASDNKNTLLKAYRGKLEATASTFWPNWKAERIIDGDDKTSWFSAQGDAAAKGKKPWVMVTFPEDVTVTRVTVLGNREPNWSNGYTILSGMVEFLDADGKQLWADENKGVGNRCDFEFKPEKPIKGVRSIKFTSLKDEGDKNPYDDIAVGELLAE